MFDSFSVGPSPNRLIKAEFIRMVAQQYGITDNEGKYKPVIMLASPGPGSTVRLSREEKQTVADGELGIAAKEMLRTVKERDFGEIAVLGFSMGAALALAGAKRAYSSDLDLRQVSVGDPTTSEVRAALRELRIDFGQATDFGPSMEATNLAAQKATLNKRDMARAGLGMFKPINWALARGLGQDTLRDNLQAILDEGVVKKLVVGYGSVMAKSETMEPILSKAHAHDSNEVLTDIKLLGVNHTWGDELPLLAKLYMRALV